MLKFSYLKSSNAAYIDELLSQYLKDPQSVDESWRYFFDGIELATLWAHADGATASTQNGHIPAEPGSAGLSLVSTQAASGATDFSAEAKVAELITAYRERGHLIANINPLASAQASHPLLELSQFGLSDSDLTRKFTAGRLIGMGQSSLREIIDRLRLVYCSSIGVEYTHIQDPGMRTWLQSRMEESGNREALDSATRKRILQRLSESETFETFLHTRYVAQKRFSVEGGESLIPTLDRIIEVGAELGVNNVVMGMAHRGRLNVLVNVYGKKPEYVLTEFEEGYEADQNSAAGDVKYHMGFSADVRTPQGKSVHLSLAHNPSHLEFVNPVVEGIARAKQRQLGDTERTQVLPILIHGDAAFAGQGVVYETLNLAYLKGYTVGGTLHIVTNNQVGFTTDPEDSRSTTYCTDLAKMMSSPVFHVNGDDPEALWYVARLCTEFRQRFHQDVFIDLVCYRKYGHNEGDEPSFTQPMMYKSIKAHKTPRQIYAQQLIEAGVITEAEAQGYVAAMTERMTAAQQLTRTQKPKPFVSAYEGAWKDIKPALASDILKPVETSVPESTLKELSNKLTTFPEGFKIHSKLTRIFETRAKSVEDGKGIDWGNGETLAYATLLAEGHTIRLSGQDVERGTFTHRHAVLHDPDTGKQWVPLNHLREGQAPFIVQNSHLSETAVLGFEYGWSLADPGALVIWEAQFGDFANGAQVIIDQFIASSESKWQRVSGLVLFLPHSYEGQGPEHSSARIERFLQLCGQNNMTICNLTTPAQLFHALRRQLKRPFRKPMVVMTPKSLLRNPAAVSTLDDFTKNRFHEIIDDARFSAAKAAEGVSRVLFCSGKVYYDLMAEREARGNADRIAIVRAEQLYPWPAQQIIDTLKRYPNAKDHIWVQEEPRNMGAWSFVYSCWTGGFGADHEIARKLGGAARPIQYIGRDISAAPAVGSHKRHDKEQEELLEKALAL